MTTDPFDRDDPAALLSDLPETSVSETLTPDRVRAAAGRDLDVLVAEAFGMTDIQHGLGDYFWGKVGPEKWEEVPHYSAGWAGAGLVLDELARREWLVAVENHLGGHWTARVMSPATAEVEESDPNVGVAVGRAALLVLIAETP